MVRTVVDPVDGIEAVVWPELNGQGLQAWVTTRAGGASTGSYATLNLGLHVGDDPEAVLENRRRLARLIGAELGDFVFCNQVHQPNVTVVGAEHRGRGAFTVDDAIPQTDALVTTEPGVVLVVMVADCVPLVLHDPQAAVLACVHAGWGGTVKGVTRAAVKTMTDLGAEPARIRAGIGPAISPADYQVGQMVRDAAEAEFGQRLDQVISPDGTGRWLFDLVRANELQLLEAGVPDGSIHRSGLVTGKHTQFFSHRADGPCGRFVAVARMTHDPD